MRVAVTGRNGQVAMCLAERSGSCPSFDMVFLGRPVFDLTDRATIQSALDALRPNVVISAAAYTSVDLAEDEPELARAVNIVGPKAIAVWCQDNGARMIHLSTDYVFGGTGNVAHVETDPFDPKGVYGNTKLEGEEEIRGILKDHVVLRTAWLYSPYGSNFVKTMLELAEGRKSINVVSDQFGNPTSALDLADAILVILSDWIAGSRTGLGQTYHLAGTGSTNWADFATFVFAESKKIGGPHATVNAIKSEDFPSKAKRPANSRLDSTKFHTDFGWSAPDWRKSVTDVVNAILYRSKA